MILRDRDANTAWESQADGTLEERTYSCQNWRADVVALVSDAGQLINQVRYDPYGVPFGISKADVEGDGDVDSADSTYFANTVWPNASHGLADWDWDGTKDTGDLAAYAASYSADTALGRGTLGYGYSHASGANRKGYAGYEIDPILTGSEGWESIYHVRHRVQLSQLGRWTRRDPIGYVDGMSFYTYAGMPIRFRDPQGMSLDKGGSGGCIGGGPIAGTGGGCGDYSDPFSCANHYEGQNCVDCCYNHQPNGGDDPDWLAVCLSGCSNPPPPAWHQCLDRSDYPDFPSCLACCTANNNKHGDFEACEAQCAKNFGVPIGGGGSSGGSGCTQKSYKRNGGSCALPYHDEAWWCTTPLGVRVITWMCVSCQGGCNYGTCQEFDHPFTSSGGLSCFKTVCRCSIGGDGNSNE